ncbi:methyltransferase domain-containing protein [Hymenobacter taeanensis]|uniref:Arsenite methyltransferase n=1 Tax=Hymenobacter taeanensis TaxID=2735321 RepID=A0A6M6BH86_9BACT|nr:MULTISPECIES: methyltransferase domain-containing protein [Hymenobacter]QJX47352.1 methyltransferase domain-containing protein [Hymenobacter taeanensis]UOQ79312.1 methyltransferase domain-containing protein [Hymenobacter sp. 5414T-23]
MEEQIQQQVQDYYGQQLRTSQDLKTNACCTDDIPAEHKLILAQLESEVLEKYYGCGVCVPPAVEGCTVLDLGSGSGRDAYLLSKLVGEQGHVIGVDMTEEQLDVARRHIQAHTEKFGYRQPNVEFRHGYIEDLRTADLADNSVDVVVSNCVLNLSTDKEATYREIFRVLKPGGELHISDVFADRRVPEALRQDPVLYGECLSGALYIDDFRRLLLNLGIRDYRLTAQRRLTINNPEIEAKVGNIKFYSLTVRAFKLDLEDKCEDYGQVAIYQGTVPGQPHAFELDDHHRFETGRPMLVCGNTADMVSLTRYGAHFKVLGNKDQHFGLFPCGPAPASESPGSGDAVSCGC